MKPTHGGLLDTPPRSFNLKTFGLGLAGAALCLAGLSTPAFADGSYSVADGYVTVEFDGSNYTVNGEAATPPIVITGNNGGNEYTVLIKSTDETAEVTLRGVTMVMASSEPYPVLKTAGSGNVTIELDGDNYLESGLKSAGLQKGNTGNLTIQDTNGTQGSLKAYGGAGGAGIGGEFGATASDIIITGAAIVKAEGGEANSGRGAGAPWPGLLRPRPC